MMNASVQLHSSDDGPFTCEIRQANREGAYTIIDVLTRGGDVALHVLIGHGQMVVRDLRVNPMTERKG